MKLLLTSDFSVSGDYLKNLIDTSQPNLTVAYIANGADHDEDKSWLQNARKKLQSLNLEIVEIDLTSMQEQNLREELEKHPIIYVEGGNTFYLLEVANKSGFSKIIRDLLANGGKVYVGTSAGSIIAGPDINSTKYIDDLTVVPKLKDFTGFSLVNYVVIPHIGNEDFYKKNEAEYNELFKDLKNQQHPHIMLRDTQAVYVEGNKFEIVEVA